MKNKSIFVIIILFFSFILTGCNYQQLNQKLIIQGIGVDKTKNEYQVTVQALDFQNPLNEDEPNTKIIETNGKTLLEALDNISKKTSLTAVYSQNLILVIGKDAAASGVNDFIDFFIRHCETRPKVKICVSNIAKEVLKIKPSDKQVKSKNLHDLVPSVLNSDILHFVSNLKNKKSDPFAAYIEVNEENENKEVVLKGVAIFKDDKLNLLLDSDEAFGFMILKGVSDFGVCTINDSTLGDVTCKIQKVTPKIEVEILENNILNFIINLNMNVSSFSFDKSFYMHQEEKTANLIENKLSEKIESICTKVMNKILKSEIDVFEFSKILKNFNPKYFKEIENTWKSILPNIHYTFKQKVKLEVTGKEPV